MYQQIQVAPDGSHWFTRHPAGSWPDPNRERCMSGQKHLYPVYTTQEHPGGGIQYIPFDDPRIRHFSSALGGNSLTDADKIRHIRNELPSVTVSEPASNDSAFLPPPLGPSIAVKLADGANQTSSSDLDNDNNRWHSDLHKETVDNFPATDQNCNRYPKNHRPPPSPSSAFQAPLMRTSSRQGSSSDQVFAETITQVKKIVPDSGPESIRNTKRRVSETIFCLVSVPVHTPTNISKDLSADQNNNETILGLTSTDTFAVGLKESLNVRSKSVNEMPIKPHYFHFQTSSTSSMRNYKRAPLRKEIIDAWALQASEEKELCYAGSWPGNQYRNQETQTGSPLTVVKSPEPQSPTGGHEPVRSVSDTTTDNDLGTDTSSHYGYPMAGQKNLHLSSNSAFSRLNLSPTELPSYQPPQQDPSSPAKAQNQRDQLSSSPRKSSSSPPESAEQEAFGQFLLKPVNRRPCDVIGELESINKEMEDTISKRPNVGQCTEFLNGLSKKADKVKSEAHFTACPEPGREAISLPSMHTEAPLNIKVRSKSLASTADWASMDIKSAFLRPQVNNLPPTSELSSPQSQSVTDSSSLPLLCPQNEPNRLYKQDIPVPQESLLKDVGLTVYTETPGGVGEPIQRSLSVPSPLDHKELSQSEQLLRENRTADDKNSGSLEHNSDKEVQPGMETRREAKSDNVPPSRANVNLSICRSFSEGSKLPQKEGSSHNTRLTRDSYGFGKDDYDERYAISKSLTYTNESTIADRHLENLLILEKANSLPAEDLSNLYEVKCAKGIPENESIEQRAARILGISVPVEALGVADKQPEDKPDDLDASFRKNLQSQDERTQQVTEENEQVKDKIVQGAEEYGVKETEPEVDHTEETRQKHTSSDHEDEGYTEAQSVVVLDLPEFPPSKLPLSLPVSPNEKLALSMCSVEKRARGGACKLIESLQDKLNSSSSAATLGRANTDRMARLKELDSVSRIRRLSLKGSDSEGKDKDGEQSEVQENTVEEAVERQEEEEDNKLGEERDEEKENENATELHITVGDPQKACTPHEGVNHEICEQEQRRGEEEKEMNVEIALNVESEDIKEEYVKLKAEEPEREAEPEITEDSKEKPVANAGAERNTTGVSLAEVTQGADGDMLPKPKQRTKLQKPPLLPKPRSVPKREITLPLSFNTGTCGPAKMEDDEMHSVSGGY